MFDNKRNTKKCDIRFQAISMYLKLARLQRIKREEYSTVKVCNLVFLCVGSNSYRYIHLSNIALLLGAESNNRPFFSFWGWWPRKHCIVFYKITKIVRVLWLAERNVCMRVCKHGCGVKLFGFSRANHPSSKLDKFTLFTHSFVGWNLENRYKEGVSIFLRLSWHYKREKSIFCKAFFLQSKNWLRVQDFVDKILRLVRTSLLFIAIQRVLRFFLGKVIL